MDISLVKDLEPLEILIYWIKERRNIQLAREEGKPYPWTDDKILRTYRFCCVRRMDDHVSRWLYTHWYKPNKNHPNSLLACMVARHFNYVPALMEIGYPLEDPYDYLSQCDEILHERKKKGLCTFNSAYIITGITEKGVKAEYDKITTVLQSTIRNVIDDPPQLAYDSMQEWVETLMGYPRIGSFTAGQIVADLRWAMDGTWSDRLLWAPQGPGSTRGLCRLLERPVDPRGLTSEQFLEEIQLLWNTLTKKIPKILNKIEMMDLQNCLCEFDKYMRVLHGEGRPKRIFRIEGYNEK